MPITYSIRADVIDLHTDAPKSTDVFLVDTNVWFWMTYNRASHPTGRARKYQLTEYPGYMAKARGSNSRLFRCELSLAELAHRITGRCFAHAQEQYVLFVSDPTRLKAIPHRTHLICTRGRCIPLGKGDHDAINRKG